MIVNTIHENIHIIFNITNKFHPQAKDKQTNDFVALKVSQNSSSWIIPLNDLNNSCTV